MKTILSSLLLITFVAQVCFGQSSLPPEKKFLEMITTWWNIHKHAPLTWEQTKALRVSQPILATLAQNQNAATRQWFWNSLLPDAERSDAKPRRIEWKEAKSLILSGKVKFALQAHSLKVNISTVDGASYFTTEPAIDDVWRVIKEVDPKGVFIKFATE